MRPPRPGLSWSRGRAARREAYASWMASAGWQRLRRAWVADYLARNPTEPVCLACGGPWSLSGGDLHHRSYDRLGHERRGDLVPLDRACHDRVHRILESSPAWGRMDRAQATDLIVALLRRSGPGTEGGGDPHGR